MTRSRKVAAAREASRRERERIAGADAEQAAQELAEQAREGRAEKVRENRLRRAAERQRLKVEKSHARDPRAVDYGTYRLVDPYNNTVVASGSPGEYGMTLDEIERELNRH